jgi:nitric oxide synthase oxygenase domain/subunit
MGFIRLNIKVGDLLRDFDDVRKAYVGDMATEIAKVGEHYINTSKRNGSYKDRTTNLRNANSYSVKHRGVTVIESIGRPKTAELFEKNKSDAELELEVGNGMEYASYVEGKGYDVCSSAFMGVESEIREKF